VDSHFGNEVGVRDEGSLGRSHCAGESAQAVERKRATSKPEPFLHKSQKRFGTPASFNRAWDQTGAARKDRPPAKPVIFYCDEDKRQRFFSEIHPLSRLIEFETGVAVGAMVTSSQEQVIALLERIFENKMEYELKQRATGLRLVEKLTGCTVRLQTRNSLLRETFWNYYHKKI
jgi:hypothetical protein